MTKPAGQPTSWSASIASRLLILVAIVVVALPGAVSTAPRWSDVASAITGGGPIASHEPIGPSTGLGDAATASGSPAPTASNAPLPTPKPSSSWPGSTPAPKPATVPVLYYHRVQAPPADFKEWSPERRQRFMSYDVHPTAFAAQLDWLRDHGYTTILPRDLAAHWDLGAPLPAQPVIITFDDGSSDWVSTVLPMLQARGMVAEFYLTLDAIEHGNVHWRGVRMLAAAGNGIGAHNVHHVQLASIGPGRDASAETMWKEVNDSRQVIGEHIGVYPDSMAYVGGGFDDTLVGLVKQAGYTTARSIQRGIRQSPAHRYQMRVVRIAARDDVTSFTGGTIDPNLPTFQARLNGVSDKPSANAPG